MRAGRPAAALELAHRLVAEGEHLLALRIVAADAGRQGQFEAAEGYYARALRLAPASIETWRDLAELQLTMRRPEASLGIWERVLVLAPGDSAALCGKARVELSMGRLATAEQLLRQALAGDASAVEARHGLAALLLAAGRLTEAELLVQQLHAEFPGNADILQLALRTALACGRLEAARTLCGELLPNPQLTPAQRADVLLQLGLVLGELDRPAAAFAAAASGKAILRDLYAERAVARESQVAKLERLAHWFDRTSREAWQPPSRPPAPTADAAATHVFLVGFARSGTTLLEQVLAGHSNLVALEEAPTLADHYAEFLSSDDGCERLARLSNADADAWRAHYWASVAAHGVDVRGRVFLDKAPAETLSLPVIAKLFPAAKILFALRDPRDVVLSCLRNAFQMNAMTYAFTTLENTAACYDACMRLAERYRVMLPLDLTEVRHETLVDGFDTELARIADLIGITVEPAMRDVAATARARPVRTPSAAQVRAGLNRRGLARWRDFQAELAPVLPILQRWVERFGYPA